MDPYTWIYLIIAIAVSVALAPKPPKPKPASLEDFDVPTAEEGRSVPVVFGTVRITGANVLWYGDLSTKKIKKSSLMGSTTIGYQYFMGFHFGLCHGPVDSFTKFEGGDKTAWTGNITASGLAQVRASSLFGGKKKEGGLNGDLVVCMGEATQTANAYLTSEIGTPMPAFRGILGLIWKGPAGDSRTGGYIGTSPYIKPFAFTVKRVTKGWLNDSVWYSAKAAIGTGMNPAHIVYETLTNTEWGMGLPADRIDEATFIAAADLLYTEGFGLSLMWNQQSSVEDFLSEVINHISGVIAFDRTTGKYRIKLIRGDYTAASLPIYGPETISRVTSYSRQGWGETVNELTLGFTDATTLKDTSVTVHDLANVRAQGVRVATKVDFPGITDATLAQKVAIRELGARSTPLGKVTFTVNRDLWATKKADVLKISWPALGIVEMVVRVLRVRQGTLANGELEIEAVEDIFAQALAVYTSQPAPGSDPTDATYDADDDTAGPSVVSSTLTAPPGSPADGASYLVPTGATGAWAGHVGEVATYDADTAAWEFATVAPGTVVTDTTSGTQVQTVTGATAVPYTPIQTSGKVIFGTSISPAAIGADQNDYSPTGLLTSSGMRISASGAARNITGLAAGTGGQLMLVHNIGALDIVLKDESASSTAANRFALNADVTLKADQSTLLQYDGTSSRWRVIGGTGSGGGSSSPTTTKGDLIVRGATLDERLAVGSPGQYLTPDPAASGGVKWGSVTPANGPNDGAEIRRATNLTVGPGWTEIAFTSVIRDDNGYANLGVNSNRLTIPRTGWYVVTINAQWDTTNTIQGIFVGKNGSPSVNANEIAGSFLNQSSPNSRHSVSHVAYLQAGDYLQFTAYALAAATLAGATRPIVASIHRLGTTLGVVDQSSASLKFNADTGVSTNVGWVWDAAEWDTGGFWSAGNPSRLTVPAGGAGKYLVTWTAAPTGANDYDTNLRLNGSTIVASAYGNGAYQQYSSARILDLADGDYVEILTTNGAHTQLAARARLQITRLSAAPRKIIRGCQWVAANGQITSSVLPVAVHCPRAATIKAARLLAGTSAGGAVVNVYKNTFAGWGGGSNGSSIVASAKPTLVAARTYSDTTLTGWTTAVNAGDVLTFVLESTSSLNYLSVQLELDEAQS
jgi:hypothetical protein